MPKKLMNAICMNIEGQVCMCMHMICDFLAARIGSATPEWSGCIYNTLATLYRCWGTYEHVCTHDSTKRLCVLRRKGWIYILVVDYKQHVMETVV